MRVRLREARGRISFLPRWVHEWWAFTGGYFWLPCPLCGREMGGHEWREVQGKVFSIPDEKDPCTFHGICPVCTYEGKGYEKSTKGCV
jgi:hypothetical protein